MFKRLLAFALLTALIAFGVRELLFWFDHVHVADARIQSDFTVLSSRVNGDLAQVHFERGDTVQKGDLLASMKTAMADLAIEALEADIDKAKAARAQVESELRFYLAEMGDKIETAKASVELLRGSYVTMEERASIARKNVERNSTLSSRSVIATQRLDDANDKLLEMIAKLRELQADIRVGERRVAELEGQRKREDVYRSRIAVIERDIERLAVELRISRQRLKDMHIYSPIRGILNEIHVSAGTYVEDGDPVLLLHDPDSVWVEANVDESDIRHVQVGQPARIEIDAYPFEEFKGEVIAIGRVTLAQIVNPVDREGNGAGAQQIPVTIRIPDIGRPLWPGMRAAVNIVVR